MHGVDVFCERCGTPQPKPDTTGQRSAGLLARRVLDAVGITENQPMPAEDWLRLCLNCRGYSCPTCWNEAAGACQTCEPMPEPVVVMPPEPVALPEPVVLPQTLAPDAPASVPYWVTQLEPLVAARPELDEVVEPDPVFVAEYEPEPVVIAEPDPEPTVVAEPEPEPAILAEPEPEPEPAILAEPEPEPQPVVVAEPEPEHAPVEAPVAPRMPVLPLPRPRPAAAPVIPLPPLPSYPIAPQIAFNAQVSVSASSQTSAPAFEAHMLLAPPMPELSPSAIAAGLRPCPSCRLTLSARAHFCRRCGAAQAA
ncbi:MAG TPA: hypothetical protein VM284_06580 [Candidatus Limnocylindria bacterium]|nr:hypothetical protein [Candidatus Limnocylindria bacterium]